jgi:hypothetical protein
MKCSDVRPLLDLLSDGALETKDSALVLDHLKLCKECQCEWTDLEQLRASFREARDKSQLPVGLMERISQKLRDEERNEHKQFFEQYKRFFQEYARPVSMMAIAVSLALIGFLLLPLIHQIDTRPISIQTASADTLIEDLVSEGTLEPVIDGNELTKRVGYELKHVRLPEWQMNKSGVYKSQATMPIARFDFVKKEQSGDQHLSCYQAPQGMIQAKVANLENLEGKRVLFGSHGKFQFALWSQNGRDYLFVTMLSKPQLEEIVRGA